MASPGYPDLYQNDPIMTIRFNYEGTLDEYKTIDWGRVPLIVKSPFWVFDTRLILDTKNLEDLGLNIWQLGIGNNN